MAQPGINGGRHLIERGVGMAGGRGDPLALQITYQRQRAIQFRCQGHQTDMPFSQLVKMLKPGDRRRLQAVFALHTQVFFIDIRAFHMDADRFRAVARRGCFDVFRRCLQRTFKKRLWHGGAGGKIGRYARLHQIPAHCLDGLTGAFPGEGTTPPAVNMNVHKARHQITVAIIRDLTVIVLHYRGDFAVLNGQYATA